MQGVAHRTVPEGAPALRSARFGRWSAPWPALRPLSVVLALWGAAGIVYSGIVIRRALRQKDYVPVLEDWFWYVALPCATYVTLEAAAIALGGSAAAGLILFVVAGIALLLLLIGIHNAWDTVVHIVLTAQKQSTKEPDAA